MNNHLIVKADNYSPEKEHKFTLDLKVQIIEQQKEIEDP